MSGATQDVEASGSASVDAKIASLADWRGVTLAKARRLINEADASVVEEVKWRKPSNPSGVPTWSHAGIICTGEVYKDKVKFTFARGAALEDPSGIFNASLDGGTRRAIDLGECSQLDDELFKALVKQAVRLNVAQKKR